MSELIGEQETTSHDIVKLKIHIIIDNAFNFTNYLSIV